MKFQLFSLAVFFAAQASAECGGGQRELFDLQVTKGGTSQCDRLGCYRVCTDSSGNGSCNGCTLTIATDNIRQLGSSYCCTGPIRGQFNTCVSSCPPGMSPASCPVP
ncbi:hypothetical protein C8035_v002051 [Colletotrichum spinosum]|uniref:Secreted protein n=1 Tax=Colletotrichum spinosum TaxID=1347390 RepID=A0A4R8PXX7_9PEZI|nr:hypothetical protein C8035_v002051 [Colletotrichum spinosum]